MTEQRPVRERLRELARLVEADEALGSSYVHRGMNRHGVYLLWNRDGAEPVYLAPAIKALLDELDTLERRAEAAEDLYKIAVSEHGHDETHSADWPSCLPVHIAMNRYRAALATPAEGAGE